MSATLVPEKSFEHHGITFAVMLATVMQTLDSTIANVALPHMQGSLAATQDQMSWVLTAYIVSAAITIPLIGWLSGYVGRKRIFLISIIGFVISSILCGVAETLFQMVSFRLLQGICGAALVPVSQAIMFDINSPRNYGKAMALWGIGVTVGPILGPALGGWLTDNYDWRWVFYINVPIGMVTLFILYYLLPESPIEKKKFDFFGFVTLSLGVGAMQLMLDRGQYKDWFSSLEIIAEALIAFLGYYLFIVHTLTFKKPFLDPILFKDRNFISGSILIFSVGIVLFATLALIPPMLQEQLNYPVSTAGYVIAPRGMGTMFGMFLVGRLITRVDPRALVIVGMLMTSLSLYTMTQYSLYINEWQIIAPGIVQGIGIGLAYVPLSTLAFSTLPKAFQNEGAAFFNLMRNLGSSIGISVVETILTRNTQIVHATLSEHITPFQSYATTATPHALAMLNAMLTDQAMMIAYLDDFKLMMIVTLAMLPFIFIMKLPKHLDTSNEKIMME